MRLVGQAVARRLIGALLAAGLLASTGGLAQAAEPSAVLARKAPDAAGLVAGATTKGSVRVIIVLAQPAGAARAGASDDTSVKASVKATVDPFLIDVLGVPATSRAAVTTATPSTATSGAGSSAYVTTVGSSTIRTFPFQPFVATSVSASQLERIAADGRVLSIHEDTLSSPVLSQSVPLIGGVEAAAAGATGSGKMVGILDTGVQYSHPFMSGRVTNATCHSTTGSGGQTVCPNGQASQYGGTAGINCTQSTDCTHGTHVAGIAAGYTATPAAGNPGRGVAPSARIFAVQVFSYFPGTGMRSWTSDQIAGLNDLYAERASLGIVAANMSLGGGPQAGACDNQPIASTIAMLRAGGLATVIASGNDGSRTGVSSPGCVSAAITVGSSTKSDVISSFSNMGTMVDVMAPGSDIRASYPTSTYANLSGTSMATPHVAGAITALKTAVPAATVDQIEAALESTGVTIVDNRSGGSFSRPRINVYSALLRLRGQPLQPANDNFASAFNVVVPAGGTATAAGTNVSATLENGEPRVIASVQATVWWKFTPSWTGSLRISTAGSTFDTTLGVYRGSAVNALTYIGFNDDFSGASTSAVTIPVTAGTTYYVQVGGYSSARGTIALNFAPPPPVNDDFSAATSFTLPDNGTARLTGTNVNATLQTGEPRFSSIVTKTVWWRFTPTRTISYEVNTFGSGFDTTLALYSGTSLTGLTLIASNDDSSGLQSKVTATLTAGTTYYVQVGGYNSNSGSVVLNVLFNGPLNDMLASAIVLPQTPGTVTGSNVGATVEAGEVLPISSVQGTVWWRFTATTTKTVDISTVGSSFDTTLGIFGSGGSKGMSLVTFNDDDGAVLTSRVRFSAVAGRTYYVQVGGYGSARGSVSLTVPTGTPLAVTLSAR